MSLILRAGNVLFVVMWLSLQTLLGQSISTPTILEVQEDDRAATIYWNSKTQTYHNDYDPDKQAGIYSYLVEWGKESEGFTQKAVTPYRVHMLQPLEPGVRYIARVTNLDRDGYKSAPSNEVTFEHDETKVNDMRTRLNGFFDDMNYPMGAFDETVWNQAYSGCTANGKLSQHINDQFHGHNVLASGYCDRAIASSRFRHPFDFTDRTGTIEFDLDGSQKTRQFWYLDLTPFSRKRDLGGHVSLVAGDPAVVADPPHLLRILERGSVVSVELADSTGLMHTLPNQYRNGACGEYLEYCSGENLSPQINVRKHWKIEVSRSEIKIFINDILVLDCSLITPWSPHGLDYEVAQLNWLLFSYNTNKENILLSMIHWDNFGIDAPTGYQQSTVIHNYTDGQLGSEVGQTGNEFSVGMTSTQQIPGTSIIPIPDSILDQDGHYPVGTDLMFTIQGAPYQWDPHDSIQINGYTYMFPEPSSEIPGLAADQLINSIRPHSAILPINPSHLVSGNNEVKFFLTNPRLLNIHIELTFPIGKAPSFTPPAVIFADHTMKLMAFRSIADTIGPGIVFDEIDGHEFWTNEFHKEYDPTPDLRIRYVKNTPVSDSLELRIRANSTAQLAGTGKAKGISYYEIWIDQVPVKTVYVDAEQAVAGFEHLQKIDLGGVTNGSHELFVQAYDVEGNASQFDGFLTGALPGEYIPTIINVQNTSLAVEYLSFVAFEHLGKAKLQWTTKWEEGSQYFVVERSHDGITFDRLGTVAATGSAASYEYVDREIFEGTWYYRLAEVDLDGQTTYSEVKEIVLKNGMSLVVSPNPIGALVEVEVQSAHEDGFSLELMDVSGRVLERIEEHYYSQSSRTVKLETHDLSAGVYFLKLQAGNKMMVAKVVKE